MDLKPEFNDWYALVRKQEHGYYRLPIAAWESSYNTNQPPVPYYMIDVPRSTWDKVHRLTTDIVAPEQVDYIPIKWDALLHEEGCSLSFRLIGSDAKEYGSLQEWSEATGIPLNELAGVPDFPPHDRDWLMGSCIRKAKGQLEYEYDEELRLD